MLPVRNDRQGAHHQSDSSCCQVKSFSVSTEVTGSMWRSDVTFWGGAVAKEGTGEGPWAGIRGPP